MKKLLFILICLLTLGSSNVEFKAESRSANIATVQNFEDIQISTWLIELFRRPERFYNKKYIT